MRSRSSNPRYREFAGGSDSGIGGTPPALVNQRQPVFSDTPIQTAAGFGANPERTANQNRR